MTIMQIIGALQHNREQAGRLMERLEQLDREQVELLEQLDQEKTEEYNERAKGAVWISER